MKKLTLLFTIFFAALYSHAQNVSINNDGTSATASAMLDVKSTTKGFMMPRVTTAQRTTIASPALGLLVFDTDTKTIWAYDGSSWKNLYTSGGGLTLPFSQTVNTSISALQITNQGTGAAIEGSSSAQFGIGMTAKTTGDASWGLFAFSNGAGSQSIRSYADNGTAFHGENNNPANTNTLVDLLNKGAGKTGSFQLANTSSTSPNVQIAGNHLGNQLKIYQTNASNTQAALSIENSGTGEGINVLSVGTGVKGQSSTLTGYGVFGNNTATYGVGVYGKSDLGIGVQAVSQNGTGLSAFSGTSYALDVNGKLKIAGGNTNPSNGAVLTSDANGNATWQQIASTPTIGFKASGLMSGFAELTNNVDTKVQFNSQEYDLGNNFIDLTENGNFTEANVFYVPVNGLYHFDLSMGFDLKDYGLGHYDYDFAIASIRRIRGANTTEVAKFDNFQPGIGTTVRGSTDLVLNAGDKIYITARQSNFTGVAMPLDPVPTSTMFSGHIVKKL